jgi:enterochelin esterase family protein
MTPAIYELVRQHQLDPASVDAFIQSHTFPIVEDSCVTFVYRGQADAVVLEHWIYGLPSAQPFTRMRDSDIWFLIQEVPEGSRIEYRFVVVRRGKREFLLDPLNEHQTENPSGRTSVLHAKGYEYPEWAENDPEAREGTFEEITVPSEAFGDKRRLDIYVPARFRTSRRYPLLIVFDGWNFLNFASLKTVLDNLIYRLEVAPMIVALLDNVDWRKEEVADPIRARFVAEELVPALEDRYPINPRRSARGLMGASYGALGALAVAWRHPGVFERVLLQSCSFAFPKEADYDLPSAVDPVVDFVSAFPDDAGRPAERVFLSCGVYESRIHENRSLLTLLQAAKVHVRYVEPKDGHNWGNWRDRLREGLSWLFPGPLWMVYE